MMVMATRPENQTLFNSLVFAALLLDEDGKIVECNPSAESMLGRSAKRLVNRAVQEIVSITDDRVMALFSQNETALVAREVWLRIEGREQRVNLTISPVNGYPGWRVLTLSDAGRDDASKDDQGTVASKGAPSILAHEIKNPLAAIRGAAQLVERKLPDANKSLAKMIRDEVDRIARLIDRMQRLGSTTTEPRAPANLHESIRAAIGTVKAANPQSIRIVEEFDPSIPPVLVNRDALEQVFINLISNALDAVANVEEPRVWVRTRFVSGMAFSAMRFGRRVKLPIEISVTDNGGGIHPDLRAHIFEPFVSSKKSGQGLGLALVRKLLGDMEGRITHERDTLGGKTHFRIHLPVATEAKLS